MRQSEFLIKTTKRVSAAAREIQLEINSVLKQPSDIVAPADQPVLPHSMFNSTRGYITKVVFQINSCYLHGAYDACAVMVRRLIEILIIECFEHHNISNQIKNSDGDYLYLSDLIDKTLRQIQWNIGRNTKRSLKRFKNIGDQSAHSRRYNAKREYIDDVILDLRGASEELLYISGLC